MKSTGIVRKLDDIGRIVMPKELRRTSDIANGTYFEFWVQGEDIILRKHSLLKPLEGLSGSITRTLREQTGMLSIICDKQKVIAAAGPNCSKVMGQPVPTELKNMDSSKFSFENLALPIPIHVTQTTRMFLCAFHPILYSGYHYGSIGILAPNPVSLEHGIYILLQTMALVLQYEIGKYE